VPARRRDDPRQRLHESDAEPPEPPVRHQRDLRPHRRSRSRRHAGQAPHPRPPRPAPPLHLPLLRRGQGAQLLPRRRSDRLLLRPHVAALGGDAGAACLLLIPIPPTPPRSASPSGAHTVSPACTSPVPPKRPPAAAARSAA